MKVNVYLPAYNDKMVRVLTSLYHGIRRYNADTHMVPLSGPYVDADLAVIFGLVKRSFAATWAKDKVLSRHGGRDLIVVESAFWSRGQYWNVGFGGINGDADFNTEGVDSSRREALGLQALPWTCRAGPVVVCGQLPWDTNVQDYPYLDWLRSTISYYVRSGVEIWFRPHPTAIKRGWPKIYPGITQFDDAITVDIGKISRMLSLARCVVTWNSNIGVDAALHGVPVIAMHRNSGAWPVASHDLDLDKLIRPDRDQWLNALACSQWTLEEMEEGLPWLHLMKS